jgi:multidrug efflux system outer membrane protein
MRKRVLASMLVAVSSVSGCKVGPDYSRPETAADVAPAFVNAPEQPQEVNAVEVYDRWWERFGDPTTAELVREALANNNDLKATAARVLQSQAALAQARGLLWPDVSYGMTRDRSKRYFNFGGGGPSDPNAPFDFGALEFSPLTTQWSQGVSVSYLVDFWGKLRRGEQAAWEDMLSAQASQQALVNSIVATVIESRISIATAQRRLALAEANTESRQQTLEITERRYQQGLVSPVEVRLARANLESSKSQQANIELTLVQAEHALDVLLGRRPGASASLPGSLPSLPQIEPVPVGVPAALLDRRPDVRAAEFSLRAANERVGVSIAQLYPDLTLTGSYGRSSDEWEDIWVDTSEIYSGIINLAAPIWKGGQLRAGIRAAKARYEEQAAVYAGVVLTAMREVEDALAGEKLLQTRVVHAERQLEESKAAEELSRARYERGVENLLTVLESERGRRLAEEQLEILKGQIWSTRVLLHLALGGDWDGHEIGETHVVKR